MNRYKTLNDVGNNKRRGSLYVIAAPSGAGKTSLVSSLVQSIEDLTISVSYTTRSPRPGDVDGVNYHFINEEKFQIMINENAFLEYAVVYGYHYGTSKQWVTEQLHLGMGVILEIDWQGARLIRQRFPDAVTIFVLPPSTEVLRERLLRRKTDSLDVIENRMQLAQDEISHYHEFDYLVVNDDFGQAVTELKNIVKAQRLRTAVRQRALSSLLADLLEKQ